MDTEVKATVVETASADCEQTLNPAVLEIDVKESLGLRHETAYAWVMPEAWEPMRG